MVLHFRCWIVSLAPRGGVVIHKALKHIYGVKEWLEEASRVNSMRLACVAFIIYIKKRPR